MSTEQAFFNEYRLMFRPLTNQINLQLEKYQLFSSQWGVMRFLMEKGPHSLVEIANYMYIEKPSVTRLVHKLVELDYVETVQGKDKREKLVQLTDHGEKIVDEIQSHLKPFLQDVLSGVTQNEIEIATKVLAKIRENIKK